MPIRRRYRSWPTALALWATLAVLAGCATRPAPLINTWQVPAPAPQRPMISVVSLLSYAHALAAATPAQREAAVRRARALVKTQPDAPHYARLALALGSPGQRLYTPDEAARYAQLALGADKDRDDDEQPWGIPARQYLTDYARLYGQISDDDAGPDATDLQGKPSANPDDDPRITRLQNQLAEARRKLHGLAHIEDRLDSAN